MATDSVLLSICKQLLTNQRNVLPTSLGCSSPCSSPKFSWSTTIKAAPVSYVRDPGNHSVTDTLRLTTGIHSEKCVVRRFCCCANVISCTNTNLDSTA